MGEPVIPVMNSKESDVLCAMPLTSIKTENSSGKPVLFHPSTQVLPRDERRLPAPSRRVWALMGTIVFQEQHAPLM